MNLLKIIVCVCLVGYSASQGGPPDDPSPATSSSQQTTPNKEETTKEGEASTEASTTEISSTELSTSSTEVSGSETTTESTTNAATDVSSPTESTTGSSETTIKTTKGTATPDTDGPKDITESSPEDSTTVHHTTTVEITTTEKEVKSACLLNPCRNGGTCTENDNVSFLFSCKCPPGYVGIRCGTVDKCVEDEGGQVCKNGACIYSADGLMRFCACIDRTHWDKDKKECREPEPPCFPNPCMNGGICSDEDGVAYCDCPSGYREKNCSVLYKCGNCEGGTCVLDQKRMTKYCKCNDGLYWSDEEQTCKELTSPCDSNPCHNGGTCNVISDSKYNCTCSMGFSGNICEVTDICSTDKDCGHGTCTLSDDKKSRSCSCQKGFYLKKESRVCEEITNACQSNPCLNDGICTVLPENSFNCTCSYGYTGTKCEVRDLCKMDGGEAYCGNGNCGNNFDLRVYFCTCKEKEYFQYTERKCVVLDFCPLVKCDSTQICKMGKCECRENYKWNNVTQKCEPVFCSSNPCPLAEMKCEEGTGGTDYKCHCKEGYAFNGTHCNAAVCIFPNLNLCNQYCSMKTNGYECSCAKDFKLNEDNHTCLYTGNSTCSNKTCDGGFCVRKDGKTEVCLCPPGYIEKDAKCTDICSAGHWTSGICPSNECEATAEDGFRCKCEGKLTLSKDKTTCMVRNVCEENEIGWKTCRERNAECHVDWQAKNGFTCPCPKGKIPTEGEICRDICSIENNQRQCSIKRATCDLDRKGKMICKCPPYFKANERDWKCTQPAEFSYLVTLPLDKSTYSAGNRKRRSLDSTLDYWKMSVDVTITMREMFTSFTQANIISCKVASEYVICKIELQFSVETETDLKRLETEDVCLTNENSNKCLLPPSLVLVKNKISEVVHIQTTNPCEEDIKQLNCGSETTCASSIPHRSFNCSCQPGYFARRKAYQFGNTNSFIEMCADRDECVEGDPCPENSICANTIGNYTCSCKPGFRSITDAADSQKCVEICHPNPCTHGECSTRGDHEFDCRCDAGYRGTVCNLQDENFKRARINTIVVGVVLGGILLITFILFAACVSRLRKKKTLENPGHMCYNTIEMAEGRRVDSGAVNNAYQRE